MTVSSTTNRVTLAGNGSTTAISFPYYFLSTSDLIVTSTDTTTGVITSLALTTDYTVSGTQAANGTYPNGGTVTMLVAPATGTTISVVRSPSDTQNTHWVDGDPDLAVVKETAFDKLTLLTQRLFDLVGRSIKLQDGFVSTFNPQLPTVMTPNYGLAVNPSGNGWVLAQFATSSSGTVKSVGLTMPADFAVGSTPVTSTGTIAVTWASQVKNKVHAGPITGANAVPTWRLLDVADIPVADLLVDSMSSGTATSGQAPTADGSGGIAWTDLAGTGTVTSVAMTVPAALLTVTGSAITGAGTLAVSLVSKAGNLIFASPNGSSGTPTFRALVPTDLPVFAGASSGADGTAGGVPIPTAGQQGFFLKGNGNWSAITGGTVTSIGLSMPAEFSVGSSPITGAGTIAVTKATQAMNTVWAGPVGGVDAVPTFRELSAVDLPVMVGANSMSAGTQGAVPAPTAGQQSLFLRGDGNWTVPSAGIALGPQSVVATGDTTLDTISQSVEVDASSPCTITLPAAATLITTLSGTSYASPIVITNTTAHAVTVAADAGDADGITGATTAPLQFQWASITLYPNNAGTGWIIA